MGDIEKVFCESLHIHFFNLKLNNELVNEIIKK